MDIGENAAAILVLAREWDKDFFCEHPCAGESEDFFFFYEVCGLIKYISVSYIIQYNRNLLLFSACLNLQFVNL